MDMDWKIKKKEKKRGKMRELKLNNKKKSIKVSNKNNEKENRWKEESRIPYWPDVVVHACNLCYLGDVG
jgi:uncharacterized protein (DUF2344 family)